MAGTKGKEAIVEGDEEIRETLSSHDITKSEYEIMSMTRRKGVNKDKDTRPAKRGKVEGKGDGAQEEEEEVVRLRGLLKDKRRRLINKEMDEVIRYLDVNAIISWALKSWQVEEQAVKGYMYLDVKAGQFVPSPDKVDRLMRLMLLCGVEKLKAVDLYILYNNIPKPAFASMLLHALDSYSNRHLDGGRFVYPEGMRGKIFIACSVLSWKLLAHVMHELTSLPVFKWTTTTPVFKWTISTTTGTSEEEDEIQKKAAENCGICYGKGKHSGVYGYYCSYWQSVPCGVTVGPMHMVLCRYCGWISSSGKTWGRCCYCGCLEGKAAPCCFYLWDSNI